MGTSVKRSTPLEQIADRAEGYDMPSEIIDGMSFREVRDKLSEIVASIRKEPHPAFVEARTYRYRGHSMSDPASYRTKEELEKYRLEDPIIRLRAQLTREGKLTNEQFDQLDKRAKEDALASVKFAERSPEPPLDDLYRYTYIDNGNSARSAEAAPPVGARASNPLKRSSSRPKRRTAEDAGHNGNAADPAGNAPEPET
jgi:pyruvate dehydrogenase E1 component alpha subunit